MRSGVRDLTRVPLSELVRQRGPRTGAASQPGSGDRPQSSAGEFNSSI